MPCFLAQITAASFPLIVAALPADILAATGRPGDLLPCRRVIRQVHGRQQRPCTRVRPHIRCADTRVACAARGPASATQRGVRGAQTLSPPSASTKVANFSPGRDKAQC